MRIQVWAVGIIVLSIFSVWPATALADSVGLSQATLDWTGFTIALSGDLTITGLRGNACSNTNFGGGPCKNWLDNPQDWSATSAAFEYSASDGFASGHASTGNGLLMASSEAGTVGLSESLYSSLGFSETLGGDFFVSGSFGTLTVTIPYTLSVACNTQVESIPGITSTTSAVSEVSAVSSHNVLPLASAVDNLSCLNSGGSTKTGTLTISGNVIDPQGSPFSLSVQARTTAKAQVHVSEPSPFILLSFGLAGVITVKVQMIRKL